MTKKKKSNIYFTAEHQQAIVDYCSSKDLAYKGALYRDHIGPVFRELVDKIVYTYKFGNLPNIESLKEDCQVFLTSILDKFDSSKGSKAFAYFSVVTKNWFIHERKKATNAKLKEIHLDDEDLNTRTLSKRELIVYNEYPQVREDAEFWSYLIESVEQWEDDATKEQEVLVAKAIRVLMDSIDEIDMFNKKAVYLYLRELTGLNTKQVVNNLNKLRRKYRAMKKDWDAGKI